MTASSHIGVSVVVPVFNERESLQELYEELIAALAVESSSFELIFVDDASSDGSWPLVRSLAERDSRVRGMRLLFNSHKAGALEVGFAQARGDIIVTMDADLQDDPREIPRLVHEIRSGADVVGGWKRDRKDSLQKRALSSMMNALAAALLGNRFHDMNTGFKAYRGPIAKALVLPGSLYRFIPHILASQGYTVKELSVRHRERKYGISKFGILHRLRGLADLLTVWVTYRSGQNFAVAFSVIAILGIVFGCTALGYLVWTWAAFDSLRVRPLLILGIFSLLFGVQMCIVRLLMDIRRLRSARSALPAHELA